MTIATSIFKEPQKKRKIKEHQPMMYKAITSQSQLYTQNNMKYFEKAVRDLKA